MKRSEEQSNKYVEDGDNELSQQSRTGTKENKKGKRAIRRGQRKNEIENILHKLRQEEYYPFWYIIGAIMYLCNNLFQSEKMKILFSNILYVERWCTMVRKFCHTCLLWTQEPKFGPSLNDIHSAFDKLTKVPLIELEKAFENIHELPSNPIMKKLFLFNVPKEFPGNPGDLFKGVILSKNAQDKLWIHHEDCSVLQTGLKVYFSEKSDVIPLFHNYEPSITMFKTVHQFWKWWHEPAQVNIFGKFKWNGPEHNILLKLGKTNMEEKIPIVSLQDIPKECEKDPLPISKQPEVINITFEPEETDNNFGEKIELPKIVNEDNKKKLVTTKKLILKKKNIRNNTTTTHPSKEKEKKKPENPKVINKTPISTKDKKGIQGEKNEKSKTLILGGLRMIDNTELCDNIIMNGVRNNENLGDKTQTSILSLIHFGQTGGGRGILCGPQWHANSCIWDSLLEIIRNLHPPNLSLYDVTKELNLLLKAIHNETNVDLIRDEFISITSMPLKTIYNDDNIVSKHRNTYLSQYWISIEAVLLILFHLSKPQTYCAHIVHHFSCGNVRMFTTLDSFLPLKRFLIVDANPLQAVISKWFYNIMEQQCLTCKHLCKSEKISYPMYTIFTVSEETHHLVSNHYHKIQLGDVCYLLIALIFYDDTHFITQFKKNGLWFFYDGRKNYGNWETLKKENMTFPVGYRVAVIVFIQEKYIPLDLNNERSMYKVNTLQTEYSGLSLIRKNPLKETHTTIKLEENLDKKSFNETIIPSYIPFLSDPEPVVTKETHTLIKLKENFEEKSYNETIIPSNIPSLSDPELFCNNDNKSQNDTIELLPAPTNNTLNLKMNLGYMFCRHNCYTCSHKFLKVNTLIQHERTMRLHGNQLKLSCPACSLHFEHVKCSYLICSACKDHNNTWIMQQKHHKESHVSKFVPSLFIYLCSVSKCGGTFSCKKTRNLHHHKKHNSETIPMLFLANVSCQKAFKMKIGSEFDPKNGEVYTMFASGVPRRFLSESIKKNSEKNLKLLTGFSNFNNKKNNILNTMKENRRKDAIIEHYQTTTTHASYDKQRIKLYYESSVSVSKRVVPDPFHAWGFDGKMVVDCLEQFKIINGYYPRQRWMWAAAQLGNLNFKNLHSVKRGEIKQFSGAEAVRRLVLQYKPSYCHWGSISVPKNSKTAWGFNIIDLITTAKHFISICCILKSAIFFTTTI